MVKQNKFWTPPKTHFHQQKHEISAGCQGKNSSKIGLGEQHDISYTKFTTNFPQIDQFVGFSYKSNNDVHISASRHIVFFIKMSII